MVVCEMLFENVLFAPRWYCAFVGGWSANMRIVGGGPLLPIVFFISIYFVCKDILH